MNRLEKLKNSLAEKHYKDSGHVPTEWAVMNFNSGFDATSAEYEKIIAELEGALEFECDCGDNSCRFVKQKNRGGMRTNGGCRCLEKTENRLKIMKHFYEAEKALQKLKEFRGGDENT